MYVRGDPQQNGMWDHRIQQNPLENQSHEEGGNRVREGEGGQLEWTSPLMLIAFSNPL